MKKIIDKIRLIYKPFVLITIGFILCYTCLHWVLFIKGEIPLKEEIVRFWLPYALPWIPILIWLRPRIKLLHFKNDKTSSFFLFLASIAITIPTIIAQEYVVTATGKLTQLDNISQITNSEKTKYYTLKNYYIDKEHVGIQNTNRITGKHNENFNMTIYIVMPVLESNTIELKPEQKYWLGKIYNERISNSLSNQEKENKYKLFVEKSLKEFEKTDFSKFTYLEVIGNTEDHDEYNNALKNINQITSGDDVIFKANTEPFNTRNGKKIHWFIGSLGIGLFVFFIILLFPKFEETKLKKLKSGKLKKNTDFKEMFDFFIPKKDFFVTPIIINLNLLIYIVMVVCGFGVISFKGSDLLNLGANFKPLITNGQWWRLLTNIFLHGGLIHILANMYGLLFVGIFLEPLLGSKKYLFVYLLTGILASISSFFWYDATVSVGASGAIFGIYGCFLACLMLKVFPQNFGKPFFASIIVFVGLNLIMGFRGGIDNAAHIGGLLSGFILGISISRQLKQEKSTMKHKR